MSYLDYYNVSVPINTHGINFLSHLYNASTSTEMFNISDINDTISNGSLVENKFKSTLKLYDIFIPAIGALSIILNLAVVVSSGLILKKGQQPRSTYLFLGNVAMTDLITSVTIIFGQVFPKESREHYICAVQIGMIVSSTLASVFSVGLIAVDRFLYILHGLQYQRWVYPMRARLCIGVTWLIGCIVGFMPLFGWYGDTDNGRKCWFILLAPKGLITLTILIGAIPLITVIVLYSIILSHAIKNVYRLQRAQQAQAENKIPENSLRMFRGKSSESEEDVQKPDAAMTKSPGRFRTMFMRKPTSKVQGPSKYRAIKVVLFTTGSFVLTWGPYFVVSLMYAYCTDPQRAKNLSFLIASPLAILGFFNTLVNPIIYAWWHKGFRSFIKKTFNSMRRKRKDDNTPTTSKETSSTNPRSNLSASVSHETIPIQQVPDKINAEP